MRKRQKDITTAWKQKIDPAFDKIVRYHADSLTPSETSTRQSLLNVPNELINSIANNPKWQNSSEMNVDSLNIMLEFAENVGMVSKKDLKPFRAILSSNSIDDISKYFSEMISALPEKDSQQFYVDKLYFYKEHPELKPDSEVLNKKSMDFYSVILSLIIRYLFVKFYGDGEMLPDPGIKAIKQSGVLIPVLGIVISSFSEIANQKTLAELKQNINKGDDKSLFKAVTIDKKYLFYDQVKKKIINAQLAGDSDFFKKLGRAIANTPLKNVGLYGKIYSVLKMYWFFGLYKLTNEELYYFLRSCGLNPPEYPDAFQKFVKRHIKKVYPF